MTELEAVAEYQAALEARRQAYDAVDDYSREHRPDANVLADLDRAVEYWWAELCTFHEESRSRHRVDL